MKIEQNKTEKLKTPISYYGGKQKMLRHILPWIPEHTTYTEPFVGGGAVFWAKEPGKIEVINDTNRELINFYECVQNEFVELEKMVRISLHSRSMHSDATVVYNNPHLFTRAKRAWAVWVLAAQSFCSILDGPFGYDKTSKATTSINIANKRDNFTIKYAERIQNVQIENTDALRIIRSRDHENAFHYIDPPYYNSNCGHYDGYTREDFEMLLETLSEVKGRFLLSSYPGDVLTKYARQFGWNTQKLEKVVRVNQGSGKPGKKKIEVLTTNYQM